ncbi:MAG: nucleotidyltransferase family protein [Candidatus Omnitrophota bacterium]
MKALLLAAGYATRLYPLTINTPKPLLPIAGRPVLEFILDVLRPIKEIDEIFIVTNERFFRDFQAWNDKFSYPRKISVISDGTTSNENRLGATGDMEFVIEKEAIRDDLLVMAGDNLFKADLRPFVDFCVSRRPSVTLGLYDVLSSLLAREYGIVSLDGNNKVAEFLEKPLRPPSTLAAMCLYFFPRENAGVIKEYLNSGTPKDAPGYFLEWLYKKEAVFGYVFKGSKWFDIGDKKSYEQADKTFRGEE